MIQRWVFAAAVAAASVCSAQGAPKVAKLPPWEFTKAELPRVAALEKRVAKDGGFHVVECANWIVKSSISPRFTAELAVYMDEFVRVFLQVVPGVTRVPKKPTIIVYSNRNDYVAAGNHPASAGMTRPGTAGVTFHTFARSEKDFEFAAFDKPVLLHEGTHTLLHMYFNRNLPTWFDEGMASYFEWWDLRADMKTNVKTRNGRSYRFAMIQQAVNDGNKNLAGLDRLISISNRDWAAELGGPRGHLNYAAAETFIDYLMSSEQGRKGFLQIYQSLLNGAGGAQVRHQERRAALEEVHPGLQVGVRGRRFIPPFGRERSIGLGRPVRRGARGTPRCESRRPRASFRPAEDTGRRSTPGGRALPQGLRVQETE